MRQLALLLAMAALIPAQEFEVASVKPAIDDGHQDSDTDNGRYLVHNLTLKRLIAGAWDLDETEVFGGPGWVDSDGWDINAKIPAEYAKRRTRDQFLVMIQRLLAERFQLTIHREPRQISGYVLVVTKSGARMRVAGPDQSDSDFSSNNTHLKATNVTMEAFARRLSRDRDIGKLVVDRTALTGKFDFELSWAREQTKEDGTTDDRPLIFTALQEQLGLKLESAKVPIQAVVIDRVERPEGN